MHNNKIRQCLAGFTVLALFQVSQVQAAACAPASVDKGSKLFAQECSVCHAVQKGVTGMMGSTSMGWRAAPRAPSRASAIPRR